MSFWNKYTIAAVLEPFQFCPKRDNKKTPVYLTYTAWHHIYCIWLWICYATSFVLSISDFKLYARSVWLLDHKTSCLLYSMTTNIVFFSASFSVSNDLCSCNNIFLQQRQLRRQTYCGVTSSLLRDGPKLCGEPASQRRY